MFSSSLTKKLFIFCLIFLLPAICQANWKQRNAQGDTGVDGTITFANPLTNPSIIIVGVVADTGTSSVIAPPTDTAGNTYIDCGPGLLVSTQVFNFELFYALNTHTTANNVIQESVIGGATAFIMVAEEWTGGVTSNPVDVYASANGSSTGTGGGQNVHVGPITPTVNGDLIIGYANNVNYTSMRTTLGPMWAGQTYDAYTVGYMAYAVPSTVDPFTGSWYDSRNHDHYQAIVCAFKPAVVSTASDSTIGGPSTIGGNSVIH